MAALPMFTRSCSIYIRRRSAPVSSKRFTNSTKWLYSTKTDRSVPILLLPPPVRPSDENRRVLTSSFDNVMSQAEISITSATGFDLFPHGWFASSTPRARRI